MHVAYAAAQVRSFSGAGRQPWQSNEQGSSSISGDVEKREAYPVTSSNEGTHYKISRDREGQEQRGENSSCSTRRHKQHISSSFKARLITSELSRAASVRQLLDGVRVYQASLNAIHVSAVLVRAVRLMEGGSHGSEWPSQSQQLQSQQPKGQLQGQEQEQQQHVVQRGRQHSVQQRGEEAMALSELLDLVLLLLADEGELAVGNGGEAPARNTTHAPKELSPAAQYPLPSPAAAAAATAAGIARVRGTRAAPTPLLPSSSPRELANIAWALVKLLPVAGQGSSSSSSNSNSKYSSSSSSSSIMKTPHSSKHTTTTKEMAASDDSGAGQAITAFGGATSTCQPSTSSTLAVHFSHAILRAAVTPCLIPPAALATPARGASSERSRPHTSSSSSSTYSREKGKGSSDRSRSHPSSNTTTTTTTTTTTKNNSREQGKGGSSRGERGSTSVGSSSSRGAVASSSESAATSSHKESSGSGASFVGGETFFAGDRGPFLKREGGVVAPRSRGNALSSASPQVWRIWFGGLRSDVHFL